ncbi:hypothetical protein [Bacillus cereus]|uniref:hypothetical protein n=1 Tax=Bacillus cereus TaxID=1396 RepID=UPI001AD92D75|nr:hypothetical protein [Bacillus cereus]
MSLLSFQINVFVLMVYYIYFRFYEIPRKYVDEKNPEDDQAVHEAELEITGEYDGNGIL